MNHVAVRRGRRPPGLTGVVADPGQRLHRVHDRRVEGQRQRRVKGHHQGPAGGALDGSGLGLHEAEALRMPQRNVSARAGPLRTA